MSHPPPATRNARSVDIGWWLLRALPVAVALAALAIRLKVASAIDLTDMPGAGGVKIIAALGIGNSARDWSTWLVAWAMSAFGTGILETARLVMMGSSVAAVVGAMLAGHALGRRSTALAAGTITAVWGLAIHPAILIGADGVAMGSAWLGAGLLWWGGTSWRRVWAVPLGAVLLHFASLVKVTAVPAIAVGLLAPLVAGGPLLFVLTAALALWVYTHLQLSGPGASAVDLHWPQGAADTFLADFPEGYAFRYLLSLVVWTAILPGRRWPARLALAAATTLTLDLAAFTGDTKARPRHLTTGALGVVLAAAWLTAGLPSAIARVLSHWTPPPLAAVPFVLAAVPSVFVCHFLSQDALAYLHAWNDQRVQYLMTSRAPLPRPSPHWQQLYGHLGNHGISDLTDVGAKTLVKLVYDAGPGGAATVVLRDNREFHLLAATVLADIPGVALDPGVCCAGRSADTTCAREVAQALDQAGARVILPTAEGLPHTPRVDQPHDRWLSLISKELSLLGELQDRSRWWRSWDGSGQGGPLPCRKSGAW